MRTFIVSFIFTLVVTCMHAGEFAYDGLRYSIVNERNKTCEVARNNDMAGDVVIPSKVFYNKLEFTVVSIANSAFFSCTSLSSIKIPASVTSIGDWAFYDCTSLAYVDMPDSLVSVGDWAFYGCSALTSIEIYDSTTSIGYAAFWECPMLTSINVGLKNPTYSSIGGVLFNKEKTELVFYPAGKQGGYSIPESVTAIGESAFHGSLNLTSLHIPNSVFTIGNGAFYDCASIESIMIPGTVTSIGNGAFYGCSALVAVEIPDKIATIADATFYGCSALESISIPASVVSIGASAFGKCTALPSVRIPDSVESIGELAFYGCSMLTGIDVDAENPCYSSMDGVLYDKRKTELIDFPCGIGDDFSIPESVASIAEYAFYGCSALKSIDIPAGLTFIGDWAFVGCSGLEVVNCHTPVPVPIRYSTFYDSYQADLHVPEGTEGIYASAEGWASFAAIYGGFQMGCESITPDDDRCSPGCVYDLKGRLIVRGATLDDIDKLAPGLYIVNGKKMLVR